MSSPPAFASAEERVSRTGDVGFWRPYVGEVLERHALTAAASEPVAGFNATHPTFICGDLVVKLFGGARSWRRSHEAERAAHARVATDPGILAPRVVAEGRLYDDAEAPWPYLVTTRMPGLSFRDAAPSARERRSIAAELGSQVRRVHALPPCGIATPADWLDGQRLEEALVAGAERSSLPPRLVAQVCTFLGRLAPFDAVFVHGDLTAAHVFVEGGRLVGIIDWGDALASDRHYELIQVLRDLFDCDKTLLRVFLEACEWPAGDDFGRQALGLALHRQAVGLAQHPTMDVFEPVAKKLPLDRIRSLDALAAALFDV